MVLPGWVRRDAVYCCTSCRARHWRWVRRSRALVPVILDPSPAVRVCCPECGTAWTAGVEHQAGAIFCSPKCRTRAWRRRKAVRDGVTVTEFRTASEVI